MEFFKKIIRRLCPDDLILDLGCGQGKLVQEMREKGWTMYGLDMRENFVTSNGYIRGDACKLPFRSNTFDVIISYNALEHIPEYEKVFHEIGRCLKDGGFLYINVPSRWGPKEGHVPLYFAHWVPRGMLRKIYLIMCGKKPWWDEYISSINYWTHGQLKEILLKHFEKVKLLCAERIHWQKGFSMKKVVLRMLGTGMFCICAMCYKNKKEKR